MKALLNWRYYVITLLFSLGFLCIALSFGEDDSPVTEWMATHLTLFACGIGLFYLLGKCLLHWEANNDIPEFTNQMKEYD